MKRRFTYGEACDAMIVGIGLDHALRSKDGSPKQLRAGVNSALVDCASLARLLIQKGLITEAEYVDAIESGMNREVESYEHRLSEAYGRPVTLAPHVAKIGGETVGEN